MKTLSFFAIGVSGLLGFAALMYGSSPNITQGPWVSSITRSSALFSWVTDQPSTAIVRWGTAPGSHPTASVGAGNALIHAWYISGAPANTKIYYVVCSATGAGTETCSNEDSFTTLSQPTIPALPKAPTPVDKPVIPSGSILTVGANCDDPNTGLVARWNQAAWGDIVEIDPAVTPRCPGSYVFPAKPADTQSPHRYILTRVKNLDSSVGDRQVVPGDKPKLAQFVHTAPNVIMVGPGDPSNDMCFGGTYRWRQQQRNAWAMYRCTGGTPKPVAAIPSSGPLDITVPNHSFKTDHMVHISGVTGTGATAVNGDWYIQVIDANTVRLRSYLGSAVQSSTGPASGGTILYNQFQLEPVTEGPAPPPTCTYGAWWHKKANLGREDEYHRTWYCDPDGHWLPYRMDPNAGATPYPPIDLISNRANHLIFQGLSIEPIPLKADPERAEYMYLPANYPSGTMFWSFVAESRYNNHIYWDQILAQCPDPDPKGAMVRCHAFANPLDGSHISVKRSYFSGFQIFHSPQDLDDGSAIVIGVNHGPGPHEISNNHIECAGICVYYTDDMGSTTNATDLTFTGNYIETPDRYWDKSPQWLGSNFNGYSAVLYWSQRHRFEAKRLKRGLISGNTFVGGWVWNNNAAAICLCTRGGAGGMQMSSINGANIRTFDASTSYDWGVEDLKPGDHVYFQYMAGGTCPDTPDQVYTVSKLLNSYSFTISPPLQCTATRGNVVRLASPSTFIEDVNISNNVLSNAPTGVFLLGHDSFSGGNGLPSAAMQRISVSNNLAINLDGTRVGIGAYSASPNVAPSGTFIVPIYGMEDLTVAHNTVYPRTTGAFINMDSSVGGPSSGLVLKANIFESLYGSAINNGSGSYGTAAMDHAWVSGTSTQYTAAYNVILRAGGGNGSPWDPTYAPFGPYPALTKWFDSNSGPFPFTNPAAGDFSLSGLYRASDRCYSKPGDCTDDGKDVGVDMSVLPPTQAYGIARMKNNKGRDASKRK